MECAPIEKLNAVLALRDGSFWKGEGFGFPKKTEGELVFSTGMMGYTQSITDCSYRGQILLQTYPLMGNYGVSKTEFESQKPQIEGYAVFEACRNPSHYTSEKSLHEWLEASGIPGISGIDTRELTKRLRKEGSMTGVLQVSADEPDTGKLLEDAENAKDPNDRDLVGEVTIQKPVTYEGPGKRIVIIDCGVKLGIVRELLKRDAEVIRVPAGYTADRIMDLRPDGVVVSNGPGDPKKAGYAVKSVKSLAEYNMPLMGICLGNQILGLALGCDTYKLKFGHRGQNHPVMDKTTGRCYITSQNHGFTVDKETVGNDIDINFVNVNDGTVEGIQHRKKPFFSVQFHPEASPGPVETGYLFDRFMKNTGAFHAKG